MTTTLTNLRIMLAQDILAETAEIDRAINQAIEAVRGEMFYIASTTPTIALVADTYEYSILSASLARIHLLRMEDTQGRFNIVIPNGYWTLIAGPTLKFIEGYFEPVDGRDVSLYGQSAQSLLTSGSNILNIDQEYVIAKARSFLYLARAFPVFPDGAVNNASEAYLRMSNMQLGVAESARQRNPYRAKPNGKLVPGAF